MTTTISELELIEHLDFDAVIPCISRRIPKEHPADWKCTTECCGHVFFLCDLHLTENKNEMDEARANGRQKVCRWCHVPIPTGYNLILEPL